MDTCTSTDRPSRQQIGGRHTAEEIAQQPVLWNALADSLEFSKAGLDMFLGDWLRNPLNRVIFTGAGSSGYIAEMVADYIDARWPAEVRALHTTSLLTHSQLYLQRDRPTLLVSFGRSGSSPESVAAVEILRSSVDITRFLNITCNVNGDLARLGRDLTDTHTLLMPPASCDRGFAMTSSLTCMTLAALAVFDDKPWLQRLQKMRHLASMAEQASSRWDASVETLAQQLHGRVIYLGSGPLEAAAKEAALKLLELTAGRISTFACTPLGFRHGPKSLLNADTLVVMLRSEQPIARRYEQDLLDELRRDRIVDRIVSVGPQVEGLKSTDFLLALTREISDSWLAPLWLGMAQRYALYRSVALGLTPDNPFPDGTVNRVVQGVTIHRHV